MADISLLVTSPITSSERRITPSWSITTLRQKLESVTGIPPSAQSLSLVRPGSTVPEPIVTDNEDVTTVGQFGISKECELRVADSRPASMLQTLTDVSLVEKYVMPKETYETLPTSVLAWKKNQKLGRFDPNAADKEKQKLAELESEVDKRGIKVELRCRVGGAEADRRGTVKFVGEVEGLGGGGVWVGVDLDEPVGKNDGTVEGKKIFECKGKNYGSLVRPIKVEVGDFPEKELDFDDEEI